MKRTYEVVMLVVGLILLVVLNAMIYSVNTSVKELNVRHANDVKIIDGLYKEVREIHAHIKVLEKRLEVERP